MEKDWIFRVQAWIQYLDWSCFVDWCELKSIKSCKDTSMFGNENRSPVENVQQIHENCNRLHFDRPLFVMLYLLLTKKVMIYYVLWPEYLPWPTAIHRAILGWLFKFFCTTQYFRNTIHRIFRVISYNLHTNQNLTVILNAEIVLQ